MDTYLPADFHRLHDAAVEDWRDAPASTPGCSARKPVWRADALCERERAVDPGWLAI